MIPCSAVITRLNSGVSTFSDEIRASPTLKRMLSSHEESVKKRPKIDVMTPRLACALDRATLSSRNASHVLAAFVDSLGLNVENYNISASALHKNRAKMRGRIASDLRENLQLSENLVVHWDGKMLPDLTVGEKVERVAILVTGSGTEQLLGIPKLVSPTGQSAATVVLQSLEDWKAVDQVKALCFDTTTTNTGKGYVLTSLDKFNANI